MWILPIRRYFDDDDDDPGRKSFDSDDLKNFFSRAIERFGKGAMVGPGQTL